MLLLLTNVNFGKDTLEITGDLANEFGTHSIYCQIASSRTSLIDVVCADFIEPTWDVLLFDARKISKCQAIALITQIQSIHENLPIFTLVSGSDAGTRSDFLLSGSWDCMSMPFSMSELIIRLKGLTRRSGSFHRHRNKDQMNFIEYGNLKFFPCNNKFLIEENQFDLTISDGLILKTLLKSKESVVSRERLLAFKSNFTSNPGALDSQISRLRKRLICAGADILIKPAYGTGYKLCRS